MIRYSTTARVYNTSYQFATKQYLHCSTSSGPKMSSASKLFQGGNHAKLYSKYRPVYPESVVNAIVDFCQRSVGCQMQTALDIGCGSGQSTIALSQYFKTVIGADVSEAQLTQTPKDVPGVSFRVSSAEDLSFQASGSVDVVTVAQAIHWVNLDQFYPEVERVLRPGGVLAIYGYGNAVLDSAEAMEFVTQLYEDSLKGYWAAERSHIDTHYRDIKPPAWASFQRDDSLEMSKPMPLSAFIGYLSSWSAYRLWLKENPDTDTDLLDVLHKRLLEIYHRRNGKQPLPSESDPNDPEVKVSWPLFILLCSKTN